jgi:hypothetical protein
MSIINDLANGAVGGIFGGLSSIISTIAGAITGKTPLTPEQQARLLEQAANLEAQAKAAEAALQQAQIEVNKLDAQSTDPFQRRWRPAVGWVCVCGLAYQFLLCPILPWVVKCIGIFLVMCGVHLPAGLHLPVLPALNDGTLLSMLGGILGLGAYRTVEKVKGSAN